MSKMPDTYQPNVFEDEIYAFWESGGYFKPGLSSDKPPFGMIKPPPNVTGGLHMGHALTDTIEDAVIRFKRMTGHDAFFVPGTDHAGIATQVVAQRELEKKGIDKKAMGRKTFLEYVWAMKERHHAQIVDQMRKMGGSLDWTHESFTLDPHVGKAVKKVFCQLYREGLIYRGERMISWCPKDETALSDLEVEQKETHGHMWAVRYPFVGDPKRVIVVETTRPETIFADTAIAVHPDDSRYKGVIGKKVCVPGTDRAVPIIGDRYVDPEFGSGALKVTPGHDFNDYEIGKRHGLEVIQVIDRQGKMTSVCGPYSGMTVQECRQEFVKQLEEEGLLAGVKDHVHYVGRSQRSGSVVEPMISTQWFVAVKTLAEPAIAAVKDGRIRFIPQSWEKTYFEWMDNIRDWCISRQLWWGHRIPAYHCNACSSVTVSEDEISQCEHCGAKDVQQESDVLDTWFSSALWPLVTLGWPEDTPEFRRFYPNQMLETGFDIIFFWVARMIMFGIKFGGDVPFREVLFHAMVRDAKGRKMSKTLGNVVDPLELIRVYGADALRFTLASMAGQGRDIKLSKERVSGYRNFMNKIWNAHRFLALNRSQEALENGNLDSKDNHKINRWVLSRFAALCQRVGDAYSRYELSEAAHLLYHFFWHEYCDWYLEFCKVLFQDPKRKNETLTVALTVFRDWLKLMHPLAPFVTEKLFGQLPNRDAEALIVAKFAQGKTSDIDNEINQEFESVQEVIRAVRNLRSMAGISPGQRVGVCLDLGTDIKDKDMLASLVAVMGRAKSVGFSAPEESRKWLKRVVVSGKVFVDPEGLIDVHRELARLQKEQSFVEKGLRITQKKLESVGFLENAPVESVQGEQTKLKELQDKRQALSEMIATMEHMA